MSTLIFGLIVTIILVMWEVFKSKNGYKDEFDALGGQKEKKEYSVYREYLPTATFYIECYQQNISNVEDLNTQYGIEKVMRIAHRLNLRVTSENIKQVFTQSKSKAIMIARSLYDYYRHHSNPGSTDCYNAITRNYGIQYGTRIFDSFFSLGKDLFYSSSAPILEKKASEREEQKELDKYISCRGRDKRIQMLTDAKKGLTEKRNNKRTINSKALMQKEHDWAMMGGLASGIAGSGAGAVTALDYQAKNAEIRRSNAQLASSINQLNQKIQSDIDSLDSDIERLSRDIEITPDKLISGINDEFSCYLMKSLEFSNESIIVSETGTIRIKVAVKTQEPKSLFDGKVNADIDGILKAEFSKNDSTVGYAYLTLPAYGSSLFDSILTGICTSTTDPNAKYSVKYSPVALWLIEK